MKLFILFYVIVLGLLFSCSSDKEVANKNVLLDSVNIASGMSIREAPELHPDSYIEWFEEGDHGLIVEKTINDFTYSVLYKPNEYELLKEQNSSKAISQEQLSEDPELQYYTLRISKKDYNNELLKYGVSGLEEYSERVAYYSFNVQKDVTLFDGADTLDCVLSHYERTYGIAPYIDLLFSFPVKKSEKNVHASYTSKTISFDDKVFGNGRINLTIEASDLNKIPTVKINKQNS